MYVWLHPQREGMLEDCETAPRNLPSACAGPKRSRQVSGTTLEAVRSYALPALAG